MSSVSKLASFSFRRGKFIYDEEKVRVTLRCHADVKYLRIKALRGHCFGSERSSQLFERPAVRRGSGIYDRGNVETVVRRGHNLDIDIRTGRFDAGVLVGVFTHRFSRETIKAAETAEDDIILTFREILSKDILSLIG
ncbi:hypothetical protein F8M41_019745 [Gigaspora margarita]|uniref:Uncharacterized protein n=1 Tax=Gigaspora margarita TaxID=4874 RepID=A0A8H4B217_GIGMA|nr:hypothetical protein F8M41_019745 [Gigaspora margarita]